MNTRLFTDEKWGTKNPFILSDERFGLVEIRAFGTYSFRINDPGKFVVDVVGTDGNFTNYEVNEHLKSLIVTRFTDTVGEANLPIELYAANTSELSETCQDVMQPEFGRVGIELEKFYIENVSMPEELKKEIFEYSRLDKLDMTKLSQFKAAKAMEAAAKNEGGTAGAGMGMGMGFVLAQQMGSMMGQPTSQQPFGGQPQQVAAVPPPMPTQVLYHYAVNGQQGGPVTFDKLRELFASRTINRDTLYLENREWPIGVAFKGWLKN